MDLGIWLAEVFDGVTFKLIVIFVADRNKVIAMTCKLFYQIRTMRYACTKDDCLTWATKDLMRLLDPGLDNIPC